MYKVLIVMLSFLLSMQGLSAKDTVLKKNLSLKKDFNNKILANFVKEIIKNSSQLEQLRAANAMQKAGASAPLGKYDLILKAKASQSDLDGGIIGNSILDNIKSTDYSVELAKQWSMGLQTSISHKYYKHDSTYAFRGIPPETHSPITSLSANLALLNNFLGINSRKELKQIEDRRKVADLTYKDQKNQIITKYISMLFDVKILKESVKLSETMYKSALTLQKVSNRKYKLGSIEERHKLSADANVLSSKQNLDASIRLYKKMSEKLNILCGFDASQYVNSKILDKEILLLSAKAKKEESKSNLKKQLKLEVEIAESDLSIAKNSKLPELNLIGSYSFGGLDTTFKDSYKDYSQNGYFVGLEFKWNIFNTSKKYITESKSFYLDSLKSRYKQEIKAIDSDEKIIISELESYYKEYQSSKNTFKKLSRRHNLELKAFNRGRTNMYNVITAQRESVMAGLNIIKLKSDWIKTIYTLMLTKGVSITPVEVN